ncbi:MAG: hypothetical protein FWE44_03625 [Defluviitaleaceae bacterium]|nr:hypothetical protein [Defluviitaleaceae bacterium]
MKETANRGEMQIMAHGFDTSSSLSDGFVFEITVAIEDGFVRDLTNDSVLSDATFIWVSIVIVIVFAVMAVALIMRHIKLPTCHTPKIML